MSDDAVIDELYYMYGNGEDSTGTGINMNTSMNMNMYHTSTIDGIAGAGAGGEEEELSKIGGFSKVEWTVLTWATRPSALCSIISSSIILFMILHKRKTRLKLIHNRILFVMSTIDLWNSIALGFSTSASPRDNTNVYGALGTKDTCTAQGFFTTLGMSVPFYNATLCLYYLAIIRYNVREDTLQRFEPYMHFLALIVPLAFAILGVSLDMMRNTGGIYCFYVNDAGAKNGYNATALEIATYVFFILFFLAFVTIIVSMALVYCAVRKQTQTMNQYQSFRGGRNSFTGGGTASANQNAHSAESETAAQAYIYFYGFLFTYIPLLSQQAFESNRSFVLFLIASIFTPLQGFWNVLAYMRPRYVEVWKRNRDQSFFWIVKHVILSRPIINNNNNNNSNNNTNNNNNNSGSNTNNNSSNNNKKTKKNQISKRQSAILERANRGRVETAVPTNETQPMLTDTNNTNDIAIDVGNDNNDGDSGDSGDIGDIHPCVTENITSSNSLTDEKDIVDLNLVEDGFHSPTFTCPPAPAPTTTTTTTTTTITSSRKHPPPSSSSQQQSKLLKPTKSYFTNNNTTMKTSFNDISFPITLQEFLTQDLYDVSTLTATSTSIKRQQKHDARRRKSLPSLYSLAPEEEEQQQQQRGVMTLPEVGTTSHSSAVSTTNTPNTPTSGNSNGNGFVSSMKEESMNDFKGTNKKNMNNKKKNVLSINSNPTTNTIANPNPATMITFNNIHPVVNGNRKRSSMKRRYSTNSITVLK